MKLARKMVGPSLAPAFYRFLLLKLMNCSRALSRYPGRIPKYMPDRIASRRFKEWQRMMGKDHPNLLASLPRLMLLGRTQRACGVSSLIGIPLYAQYDMEMKNMKFLRAQIRTMISGKSQFSLEFHFKTNHILVVHFRHSDHGNMTMRSELYDRINGKRDEVMYDRVSLVRNVHTIDFMSGGVIVARFFYTSEVFVDLKGLTSNKCSLVSFYRKSPEPPTYACIQSKRRRIE
jgi:hypothetical protein